ncbi:hypothetical protein R5O87_22030 [Arthrobacter globiformis]|uniref:hypothetical protein n=1 Tax=Arthrobacter globiformis TaxID=1665 RepID=UPI00397D44D6
MTTSSDQTELSWAREPRWPVWSAVAVAWLIGFISNFMVAPTNTGMGVVDSYASFQTGSNFGNGLALVIWSGVTLLSVWLAQRWAAPKWATIFGAYGLTAIVSLYPSAVISNAVAHVVALEDSSVYHDWLAWPLVLSGLVAVIVALVGVGLHPDGKRNRAQRRVRR